MAHTDKMGVSQIDLNVMSRPTRTQSPLWSALAASLLYFFSAAPGLTWANQGADGGDLLTAAVTNGVPHPPGYPLYTMLLQAWLGLLGLLVPNSDIAWRGNLLSVLCATLSVGITVLTAQMLLTQLGKSNWPAGFVGIAWAISPLLWSQATITEVYALHTLLFSLLGLWAIQERWSWRHWWGLLLLTILGVAHHLTILLLLPAAIYLQWSRIREQRLRAALLFMGVVVAGIGLGLLFQIRSWLAASTIAPVNWGFVSNWADLWWLISGQAYRGYLLSASAATTFDRVAAWAYTITTQFTPVGLALALIGLGHFDQEKPKLRNFSLLWIVPISIYAILYYTRDSEIYLLPAGWLLTIWLAVGLAILTEWLQHRFKQPQQRLEKIAALLGIAIILVLGGWRWSTYSLRQDSAARQFLAQSAAIVPPGSILISRGDEHTFALWYGTWAGGELPADLILVNDSLYQFAWYRRLLAKQYPSVQGVDQSVDQLIQQNKGQRAIFLADDSGIIPSENLIPLGPLWQVRP